MADLSNPLVAGSVLREQDTNFLTKGQYLPVAAVASTLSAVGNSANWVVQKLGGDGWGEADAAQMLSSFSQNAAEYYQDNAKAVDTVSTLAVSLATFNPVAAFRTAASGLRFAAPEMAGMGLATRGTGYVFGAGDALETWALTRAADAVKNGATSPFWRGVASPAEFFSANGSGLAMAAGKGYSFAVEAAASELLTFSLMHQSSAYEGITDFSSLRNHLTNTALFGGAIGAAGGVFARNITKFDDAGTKTTIRDLISTQEETINLAQRYAGGAPSVSTFASRGDNLLNALDTHIPEQLKQDLLALVPKDFQGLAGNVFDTLKSEQKAAIQTALVGEKGIMQGFAKVDGTDAITRQVFSSILSMTTDEQVRLFMAAENIAPVTGRTSGKGSVIFNPKTKDIRFLTPVEEGAERTQLFRAADRAGGSISLNASGIKLGDADFARFTDFNKTPLQDVLVKSAAQDAEVVWAQGWFSAQSVPTKNLDVAAIPAPTLEGMLRQGLVTERGDQIVAHQVLHSAKLEAIDELVARGVDLDEIAFRLNATTEYVQTRDIQKLLDAPHPVSVENVQVNYSNRFDSVDEWSARGNAEWEQRIAVEQARVDALLMPVFGEIDLPKLSNTDLGRLGGDSADVLTSLNAAWGSTLETLSYAGQQMFHLRNRRAAEIEAQLFHPAKELRKSPDALFAANVLRTEQLRVPSNVGTVVDTTKGVVRTGAGYKIEELSEKAARILEEHDSLLNPRTGRAMKGNGKRVRELRGMLNGIAAEKAVLQQNLNEYLANGGKDVLFAKPARSAQSIVDELEALKTNGVVAAKDTAKATELEALLKKTQREEAVWNFTEAYARSATKINPIRQSVYTAKNMPFKTWADPVLAELEGVAMDLHFPPTPLKNRPFLGFVKDLNTGEVGAYSASSQKEFAELTRKLKADFPSDANYRVYDAPDIKLSKQLDLEYEHGLSLQRTGLQRNMARKGHSADINVSATDEWLSDLESHTARELSALYREAMVVKYGQQITNLDWMSKAVSGNPASRLADPGEMLGRMQNAAQDKYAKAIKTMLNLSDKEAFPMWTAFGETLERVWSESVAAFQTFVQQNKVKLGKGLGWEEAAKIQSEMGVTHAVSDPELWANANKYFTGNARGQVDAVRTTLANLVLRWDLINPIVQSVGSTVLQLPAIAGAARQLGVNEYASFGAAKLLGEAFKDSVKVLGRTNPTHAYLKQIGVIPESADALRDFLHEASRLANADHKEVAKTALGRAFQFVKENTLDKVGKLTDSSEYMARYAAGYAAMKLGKAAGKEGESLNAFVQLFVNKAAGNYMAAQRPQLFNGFGGATISLFQSYSLNLVQQFGQHIADGNKRLAVTMAAVNGGLFGSRSLPFVDMFSDSVLAQKDNEGRTLDSTLVEALGPNAAEILQYGPLSSLLNINLYTRGNATPRSPVLVPTNPADLAIVSYASRTLGALKDGLDKAWSGAPPIYSAGEAIAHAQINRPLTGLLETALGVRTSAAGLPDARTGPLMWQPHSLADYANWETAVRLAGGKPLAEAVQLDALHRFTAFKAGRQEKINQLAQVARAQRLADGEVDYESLREKYLRYGGTDQAFKRWVATEIHKADSTRVEDFAAKNRNSPWLQSYNEIVVGTGDRLVAPPGEQDTSPYPEEDPE